MLRKATRLVIAALAMAGLSSFGHAAQRRRRARRLNLESATRRNLVGAKGLRP